MGNAGSDPYEYMEMVKLLVSPIIEKSNKSNWVVINYYANDNIEPNFEKELLLKNAKSIIKIDKNNEVSLKKDYLDNLLKLINRYYPSSQSSIVNQYKKTISSRNKNWKNNKLAKVLTLEPIRSQTKQFYRNYIKTSATESSIELLTKICKHNCKPIIVYVPNQEFWFNRNISLQYKKMLQDKAKKNNITFLDGGKVIDSSKLEDYSPVEPNGPHLSIQGYRKIAELIITELGNK